MKKIILVLACGVASNFGIGMPGFLTNMGSSAANFGKNCFDSIAFRATNIGSSVTNFAGKCVDPIVTSMINNPKLTVALIAGSGFYVNKYADCVTLTGELSPLKGFSWSQNNLFSKNNLKLVLNVGKRTFDLVVSAPWKLLSIGQKNVRLVPSGQQYILEGVVCKNETKDATYCPSDFSGPDIGRVLTACSLFGLYYLLKTREI